VEHRSRSSVNRYMSSHHVFVTEFGVPAMLKWPYGCVNGRCDVRLP